MSKELEEFKNNIEFLKKAHRALKNVKTEKLETEFLIKQNELDLKHHYASKKDLRNKKGEVDIKMVKSSILKTAIEMVQADTEKNKLEENLELLLSYVKDIKEGVFEKELVKSYATRTDNLKEIKGQLKVLKGEYAGLIDKEENKAVDIITDEEIKVAKEEKEVKFRKDNGLPEKKQKNSENSEKSNIEEVIKVVKTKLELPTY